jgi:phage-related protein
LVVNNAGNEFSPPTIIVRGPGTNFVVQNISTGKKFNLNLSLLAGEEVTINTLNRTVVKGNNQNVFGAFTGEFWFLRPGNNAISFNAVSGTDAQTRLTIRFRSAWRGV